MLTIFTIGIGIASLIFILSLSQGLKQIIFQEITGQSPLNQIIVQSAKNNFIKLPSQREKIRITPKTLAALKNIQHVVSAWPEINYANISSLQVNISGKSFETYTMIFGVPYEFLHQDFENIFDRTKWTITAEPYPIVIPRRIIDLYNLTVAPANNLPALSENDLINKELILIPDNASFFSSSAINAKSYKIKIIGFSDKVNLTGVTLPLDIVKKMNLERDANYQENYLRVFVRVDNPTNVETVRANIEGMGLETFSTLKEAELIEENFKVVTMGLSLISLIILLISGLMIANVFSANISERKSEIGIFRALGATHLHILRIFLTEASLLGFFSGLIGIIAGIIGGVIFNQALLNALPDMTSKPETIFIIDPAMLFFTLLFTVILSIVFAFIPTIRAALLQPLEALNR